MFSKTICNSHSNFELNTLSRITSLVAFKNSNYFLSISEDGRLIKWSLEDQTDTQVLNLSVSEDGVEQEYQRNKP